MDIVQLAKSFQDFELKIKLFNRRIDRFSYWDFIRYPTYIELMANSSSEEISYIYKKKSLIKKSASFFLSLAPLVYYFINLLIKCAKLMIFKTKYDIIFYSSGDNKIIEGKLINPYCYFHLEELAKNYKILVLECQSNSQRSYKKINCDHIYIPWKFGTIFSLFKRINSTASNEIKFLSKELRSFFCRKLDLKSVVKTNFFPQLFLYRITTFIVRNSTPKMMGFLNDGNAKFFLKTAKDFKVPSVEFQHGDVSNFDIVSSYPDKIEGNYWIPDKIFIFGNYWKNRYNLKSEKIVIGNPVFDIYKKKYSSKETYNNNVLCISVNSVDFAKFVFDASKIDSSIKFYLKLRDSEYDNWKKNYPFLINTDNFSIIDNNNKHLYDLIKQSKYIISTISTVIYEALSLDTNVIVVKNNDFPYVKELKDKCLIKTTQSVKGLIKIIRNKPDMLDIEKSFFYKPNCIDNFKVEIKNIINEQTRS